MSDEKNKIPGKPFDPSDLQKIKNDIIKGGENRQLNDEIDWSKIDEHKGNFTNNLPDYDAPPPPPGKKDKE